MKRVFVVALFVLAFLESYSKSYKSLLIEIRDEMYCFRSEYESMSNKDSILEVAGDYIHSSFDQQVYKRWEGTPWDFDGYTNIPNQGAIACGYFVSTALKHMGLRVNRYKMAQQSALNEVKTLDENYFYLRGDRDDFVNHVRDHLSDGLYVLGLSNHVGYLSVEGEDMYFIHSNYLAPEEGVTKENVRYSQALAFNDEFLIGAISNNRKLMKKWLFQNLVKVILDE